MDKKKITLIDIIQIVSILLIFFFYFYTAILNDINTAKYITGLIVGILLLMRGIYDYKVSKKKRIGIFIIIVSIIMICLHIF